MIIGNENVKLYGVWSSKIGMWFNRQMELWVTDREELAIAQASVLNSIDLLQYKNFIREEQAKAKAQSQNQQGIVNMPPPPGGNGRGLSGPATLLVTPPQLPTFESSMWESLDITEWAWKQNREENNEQTG